jgi:hypothetical protein
MDKRTENIKDVEGIKQLFKEQQKRTLECIKSDWTLNITSGNKYIIECSDGNWIKFRNDKEDEIGLKINNAINYFRTITSSRKTKLNNLLNKNK